MSARQEDSGRRPYLTPAQVMKWMEDSKVQYRLDPKDSPPGGWAEELWPLRVEPLAAPRVAVDDGQRVLQEWPGNPKAEAFVLQAEEHYRARRYAEAARLYEQALTECPDCYLARAYLGDATLFGGDAAGALVHYQKAAETNPHDYRLYYFQGSALARLGRMDEAVEAWIWSLVLFPRNPVLRQFFQQHPELGLVVLDDVLAPRGFARKEGEEVIVEFDPDYGAAWLAFANCKALWLGEPTHRQEMTGTTERHFSSVEETECLASTAVVHEGQKNQSEEGPTDASLDRLTAVIRDGMITELVLFELAARVHPQYTLTLADEDRQRLREYVVRHVLLPVGRR
ncbi:tetratricopeptide repeat protein [Hyalangium rubrum]|uniref:tetratricopeptide repeat protein n=1 Tax=Hyalangium rubrum TaxID=3103134 RepID=UPI002AAB68D6|nr:tetratricopeptide repeat protein [Hyalangium sp. s54d21]